jgi:hypothetical protein
MSERLNPWIERAREVKRKRAIEYKRRTESPARKKAWQAVQGALRRGLLVKTDCELHHSGCETRPTAFHHTHGYAPAQRLTGVWACANCHDVETARSRANRMEVTGPGVVTID